MKKLLSALLCFCILLTAAACARKPQEPPETTAPQSFPTAPAETTAPTVPATEPIVYQSPLTALTLKPTVDRTFHEDGTELSSFSYQVVYLVTQDAGITEAVSLDLMNRIDAVRSTSEAVRSSAEASYDHSEQWYPFFTQIYYTPTRIDAGVLSLLGEEGSYSGGIHPNYLFSSVSYDLLTGKVLSLADVLTDGYSPEQLCQLVLDALQPEAETLYTNYADVVLDRFAEGASVSDGWYFSENGLCFFFSPYEIAPYAAGPVVAEILYEKLVGVIKEAYFPAELLGCSGTAEAVPFTQADITGFSQFAEAILDRDAPQALLYTDGAISNVRLQTGALSPDGTFQPELTVLAVSTLGPGQAVTLQADLESTPLYLTYTSAGETLTRLLTMENGVLTLK